MPTRASLPPQQALIMTHELARVDDFDDFFAQKLHPLEPVLVYGRSYKANPPCKSCQSLWWGWKDPWRPVVVSRNREPTALIHASIPGSTQSLAP